MATIYDKPARVLMRNMADELLQSPDDTIRLADAVTWFKANYPAFTSSYIAALLYNVQTNAKARGYAADESWDILYAVAPRVWRRYDPTTDPPPASYKGSRSMIEEFEDDDEPGDDIEPQEADAMFAYEHHLRDYLARNMHLIEPGLTLHGVEVEAGGQRRIDLLGIGKDGGYVVVELKVSRAYDRVIGQAQRYMGWVEQNLAQGKPVRGVIIANEITDDLRLANRYASGIRLVKYSMAVELQDDAT
ncbi:MAG: endonuclease NucS [Cyanobacteria bacterium]|nr:endonuclease NucS [Cyanobacteriota bacterium]